MIIYLILNQLVSMCLYAKHFTQKLFVMLVTNGSDIIVQ